MSKVGEKHDAGKPRYDLMPVDAERMVIDVLTYGAMKYAPENWRHVENAPARYYAAARRHMEAWRCGEMVDDETGFHHLSHAICCLLFQLQLDIERKGKIRDFFKNAPVPDGFPDAFPEPKEVTS